MKKLFLIILTTLLYSCGTDRDGENYNYSIINNSGVKVELIPTFNGIKSLEKKVDLENGAVFNKSIPIIQFIQVL
jgi:hypothetical protein